MNKIKIGVQVTAKVCPTKVTVSGTFQGYELQDKEDPTSVCGKVFYVKDGMQLLDFVYVDSIKVCDSEDERIRKELLDAVDKARVFDIDKDVADRWTAWLEKQKEQKPAEWSEEDGAKLGALINYFDGDALDYSTDDIVNWLKSLRPQSKQKQNDYITPHKEFFKFIYDRLINVHKENPNVDYMRSFKERLNNLSFGEKQEWSEEDEEMLNSCISSIEESKENRYAYKETDGDTSYDREIDWLKSLRPQPHKEIYQATKHDLAIKFMNYLDENRPEGKMSLSNAECEDIDKAFKENDWNKIFRYIEKYGRRN